MTGASNDFGEKLRHLVERAVEGRLVSGEEAELWSLVNTLTHDRQEPVTEAELVLLLKRFSPLQLGNDLAARGILQATVITKRSHVVWARIDQGRTP